MKKFDLIYVEGPGDLVESFRRWNYKEDVISETSKTFSGQFFDFCKSKKLKTYAISYCNDVKQEEAGDFFVENRPKLGFESGALYHIAQILYGLWIVGLVIRYRPKYLSLTSGVTYWLVLAPVKLLGVKIMPQLHNTLWPKGYPPVSRFKRILLACDGLFFRYFSTVTLCVSPEIKRQIESISTLVNRPVFIFFAQFYREDFDKSKSVRDGCREGFKIIFVGRVERNKGVFDLLDMAEQLKSDGVTFDVCGGGAALDELKKTTYARGLDEIVTIHGMLKRPQLLTVYDKAHAVIVPTKSDFCEGMPQVVAESVLLGRPVITTKLSNALDVVGSAIVEAQPDNVESYVRAIKGLLNNTAHYDLLCQSCEPLREQFLDGKKGLAFILAKALRSE